MNNNWVITVGREFCSGGAEIARKVAEKLNIPYYDKKIIDETAKLLKVNSGMVAVNEEKPVKYWEISGFKYYGSWYHDDPSLLLPLSMRISDAQFRIMKEYAEAGSCVLVGRCADYVLKDRKNVLNVFIYSDMENRICEAVKRYHVDPDDAEKLLKRTDKIRSNYYNGHTYKTWGSPKSYDLCINSAKAGKDFAADIIVNYIKEKSEK